MASKAARTRVCICSNEPALRPVPLRQPLTFCQLTREYKAITENPPPYITAHPSETNILESVYTFFYLLDPAYCPRNTSLTRCP